MTQNTPNNSRTKMNRHRYPLFGITFLIAVSLIHPKSEATVCTESHADTKISANSYLFVWAGDKDSKDSDFLAVVDARPGQPTFGEVIATLPVGTKDTFPHHTEYEFPETSKLFVNGWGAGRTFIIDLEKPTQPKLVATFTDAKGYSFPHSFARLPNGNVLATFQVKQKGYEPPGALVELNSSGRVVRTSSADVSGIDKKLLWPYSVTALPEIDRVVTTSTEMGLPKWALPKNHGPSSHKHTLTDTTHIQIWSLKDLRLLATIPLPPPPKSKANLNPAEPRLLPDGSLYVNTFNCGLYRVLGLQGPDPKAEFVYAFPGADKPGVECAVPVVFGRFWIQTDPSLPGLIALDVTEPAKPVEVSRLVLDRRFNKTHWVAADRTGGRLVVTGNNESWVLLVSFNAATGRLTLDENFKEKGKDYPGIDFNRSRWPHGETGPAFVHGAVFGPSQR